MKPLRDLTPAEVRALDPETLERFQREVIEPVLAPYWQLWDEQATRWEAAGDDAELPADLFGFDVLSLLFAGSPEERLSAAQRIAKQLDLRLHRGRKAALTAHELRELAMAALFEVAHDGVPGQGEGTSILDLAPSDRDEALRRLRVAVLERLTRDALGPAWRAAQRDEALTDPRDLEALAVVAFDEPRELDLAALIASAGLTAQERLALEAFVAAEAGEPQAEIAQRTGLSPGNFRVALFRARRKIGAAL